MENAKNSEPFNDMGYGVVAYLGLMRTLMLMFLLFSVLMLAPIYFYSQESTFKGLPNYYKT